MKYIAILLSFFMPLIVNTQDKAYQTVMEEFTTYYNTNDFEAIHNMFDANMKIAVTESDLKQQLSNLHNQAGNIENVSFIENKNKAKIFKVNHSKMALEYTILLDTSNKIMGLRPKAYRGSSVKVIDRNTTEIILPFNEEWDIFWGGTEISQNYHVAHENQKYAYDILIMKNGVSHKDNAKKNSDYYVFGKNIIAPCDAKVVKVIRGVIDNIPGELNPEQLTGNTIILETNNKEYILFAHLKQNSITVKEGDLVKQNQIMGQCGNSGNTSEPHLHLSLQNTVSMLGATGGKLFFNKLLVNGELKEDYLPIKGDKIQNIKY